MNSLVLAFLIGVVAGLRSMTAPAFVAWGARLRHLQLVSTPLAWLGSGVVVWLFTALALAELVGDKLPQTPSRKATGPFAGRILTGALSGAALMAGIGGSLAPGAGLGAIGAIAGTLGGYAARTRVVRALGVPDPMVAVVEDIVAVGGAALIVMGATLGR